MALVWRDTRDGVNYEVRNQGRTMRLYANDVQHSEFHPQRLVTGSVWDLLWLPGFFLANKAPPRVLVLGLGGGSLVPPIRALFDPSNFQAVELDELHLYVARRFFAVEDFSVECHCANAVDFVQGWDGEPFDLVIEDLFAPSDRTVSRAVNATGRWFGSLSKLVAPGGVLVMNFGDWAEYKRSWCAGDGAMRGWSNRFRLSTPDCHNAVMVWTREAAQTSTLRSQLNEHPNLNAELESGRLNYRAIKLD